MKVTLRLFLRATVGLLLGGTALLAQGSAKSPEPVPAEPPKTIAYRIAPSDKLSISIIGESDLNAGNKRVDASGNINLALVNDVRVASPSPKHKRRSKTPTGTVAFCAMPRFRSISRSIRPAKSPSPA